jgi:hypothetical protein
VWNNDSSLPEIITNLFSGFELAHVARLTSSLTKHVNRKILARRPRVLWETRLRAALRPGERHGKLTEGSTDGRQELYARREERSGVPRQALAA